MAKSCPTHCDPMYCNMPGYPVSHHLPEFAQVHVHWNGGATQPYHPLSLSPSREKAVVTYKETLTSINSFWRIFLGHSGLAQHIQSNERKKKTCRQDYCIQEKHIAAIVWCPFTPVIMATMKRTTSSVVKDVEKRESMCHGWWDCKLAELLWKRMWNFL